MDLASLKSVINEHLQSDDVYEQIRACLSDIESANGASLAHGGEERALKALQDAGLIDNITRAVDERHEVADQRVLSNR